MATWDIVAPSGSGVGGTGSNTSAITAPGDFDGATINSVTLQGTPTITGSESSNDDFWIRWYIANTAGTDIYGGDGADADSIVYQSWGDFSTTPANLLSGGAPTPAPTTAVAADWDDIKWNYNYTVAGKDDASTVSWDSFTIRVDYTPVGSKSANGDPEIASPTASGSAKIIKTATGAATLAAVTCAATTLLAPEVYLNTTETTSGATQMTVTSWNTAGTSITFTDPKGAPVGSLKLGVTSRNAGGGDSKTGWIDVTVAHSRSGSGTPSADEITASGTATKSAGDTKTASGTPDVTSPTSAATVIIRKEASGTPSIEESTASGVARFAHDSSGTPSIAGITASGQAGRVHDTSGTPLTDEITAAGQAGRVHDTSGTPETAAVTASGTARFAQDASGTPTIDVITASGSVDQSYAASGTPSLDTLTASGVAGLAHDLSGTPSLDAVTASGVGSQSYAVTGSPLIEVITASGVARFAHDASGAVTLVEITTSGVAGLSGLLTTSGTPSIEVLTAASTVIQTYKPSGTPSTPTITASGVARFAHDASGTPSASEVTASGVAAIDQANIASGTPSIDVLTASGTVVQTYKPSSAASIDAVTASGVVSQGYAVSGTPSVTAITASGTAETPGASGTPSIPALTASGTATLPPTVWLNTTPDKSGAVAMTVTAYSDTSITFDDPTGVPIGNIYLGVENRRNSLEDWIAVTVAAYPTGGDITIGETTASGVAGKFHDGSGTPEVGEITARGWATLNGKLANSHQSIPTITANGRVDLAPKVWLSPVQNLANATELTVTSFDLDGTSITFDDPVGPPFGNVHIGVENRNAGGGADFTGWRAVTVEPALTVWLSRTPAETLINAVQMTLTDYSADGTSATFDDPEGPLTGNDVYLGVKRASDDQIGWIGVQIATLDPEAATGSPSIDAVTCAGLVNNFTGTAASPSIPFITVSDGEGISNAISGDPSIPVITASGSANLYELLVDGTPSIPVFTASGTVTGTEITTESRGGSWDSSARKKKSLAGVPLRAQPFKSKKVEKELKAIIEQLLAEIERLEAKIEEGGQQVSGQQIAGIAAERALEQDGLVDDLRDTERVSERVAEKQVRSRVNELVRGLRPFYEDDDKDIEAIVFILAAEAASSMLTPKIYET